MNVAVTGKPGGLVRDRLLKLGVHPINADITNEEELKDEIRILSPDIVIHAAAMTNVEDCENNIKKAFEVNVRGTTYVAEACNLSKSVMVYLSTCHMYDGTKNPQTEKYDELSRPNPKNAYGFSKWQGGISTLAFADRHIIVTISKLFSSNLYRMYLNSTDVVDCPTFMWRNYTHVNHFCDLLLDFATRRRHPAYINLGSRDYTNAYDFQVRLFDALGIDSRLVHPRDYDKPGYVFRPKNGILNMYKAELFYSDRLPTVQDGIDLVAEELL